MISITKWNALPAKLKWAGLLSLFLLLSYLAFTSNIQKTLHTVSEYKSLRHAVDSIAYRNSINNEYSNTDDPNIESSSASLLQFLSAYCEDHDIVLLEITQVSLHKHDETNIETNKIRLQGSYTDILKLINIIETENIASINSASWQLDKMDDEIALTASLYIKHLKNEENS